MTPTMNKPALLLICLAAFFLNGGQIWRDKTSRKNAEGNELYEQKNYGGALENYIEAEGGKQHQSELSYNIGNALYQQKKYPEAVKELEKSISSSNQVLNQKIYFNRGNSFYQMGQYPQAVESYKKALELDPKDRDAKHNLELALRKIEENPQQQKQNSDHKDQQQQKDSSAKNNQQEQNQRSDQQKQPNQPHQPNQSKQPSKAEPKQNQAQPNEPQRAEQKPGMDPKEALRILDAINNQEKKEQRKQVLKIQRQHTSGRDW